MGREEDQLQLPTFQGQHPISLARRRLDHCMVSCEAGGTIQATWWTSGGRGRWRAPGTANLRPLPGTVVRRPVAWGPLCDSISARPRACRTSSSTDLAASLRDAQRPLSHTARPFLPARRPERIKDGRRILDPREHRQPPGLVRQRLGWRGRIARHQPPDGLDRTNSNRQEEEARASLYARFLCSSATLALEADPASFGVGQQATTAGAGRSSAMGWRSTTKVGPIPPTHLSESNGRR